MVPRGFSPSQENATMNAAGRRRGSCTDEVFCDPGSKDVMQTKREGDVRD